MYHRVSGKIRTTNHVELIYPATYSNDVDIFTPTKNPLESKLASFGEELTDLFSSPTIAQLREMKEEATHNCKRFLKLSKTLAWLFPI